jgi:hypothetical protein
MKPCVNCGFKHTKPDVFCDEPQQPMPDWKADCLKWRGHELTGQYAHWCPDWDGLPVDDTCPEFPCACFAPQAKRWFFKRPLTYLIEWLNAK